MASIGPVVSEENMFENVDGEADDGRTDDACLLCYKLTYEPKGSGDLKYGSANSSSATRI